MQNRFFFGFFFILICASLLQARKVPHESHYNNQFNCLEDIEIDIEDDVLFLTNQYDSGDWIEITPNRQLYIRGERIHLNQYQRRLVGRYYDQFFDILDQAKKIGKEGAKLGIEGAKIGVVAAGATIKMLFAGYDDEDLEREIEEQTDELEEQAEDLEEMADELEEMADEFEDLHYKMKDEIPQLDRLNWF